MKITLERSDALSAINRVIGVVARNSNVPILNNVLITTDTGSITLRATDLDMQAVTSCPADVQEPGAITVDANRLREIVNAAAPGSELSFELDAEADPRIVIRSGRSKFRLGVLDGDQFPTIPDDEWASEYEIEADVLSDMLSRASVSVSQDVSRPMLAGVYLSSADNILTAVGTSGFRLTTVSAASDNQAPAVIIPAKSVAQFVRLLGDATSAQVFVSKGKIRITVSETSIVSKVIDYDYPDYKRVIPSDLPHVAHVGKETWVSAVRRAQIAGSIDTHGSGVRLTLADGVMVVTGKNSDADATDEIEIEYDGPEISIGVTAQYILDALSNIGGEIVHLNMLDDKTPVTITSPTDADAMQMLVQRRVA